MFYHPALEPVPQEAGGLGELQEVSAVKLSRGEKEGREKREKEEGGEKKEGGEKEGRTRLALHLVSSKDEAGTVDVKGSRSLLYNVVVSSDYKVFISDKDKEEKDKDKEEKEKITSKAAVKKVRIFSASLFLRTCLYLLSISIYYLFLFTTHYLIYLSFPNFPVIFM